MGMHRNPSTAQSPRPRIVLIGGGFAGIACGRTLRTLLPGARADITLFNEENHAVFHPLLAEVAAGAVRPTDVAASLRQLLAGVECRTEHVVRIDLESRAVHYEDDDGRPRVMHYDHVVIAAGGTVDLSIVPGMAEHGMPLKTIGDALAIQSHVMEMLEKAEVCGDPVRKAAYLSFLVVGGGFSGVELAGELHDLVTGSLRFFHNILPHECRVTLVHSRDEILPEVSAPLRRLARTQMEKRGIRFVLENSVVACTPDGVALANGTFLRGRTVVCTIGGKPAPLVQQLDVAKVRGRLEVAPDMALNGRADAWAIGDCAAVTNAHDGRPSPPTGQFAERQGVQVAHNIAARLAGRTTRPFAHRSLGSLCSIGGHQAVAEIFGLRISGLFAWLVWRGVYLMKLPSFAQRLRVAMGLLCDLVLPRPLAHQKTDTTRRVSRAFYRAGDTVFRRDDPATAFYVVQSGEVEILDGAGDGAPQVTAVLGRGDFFGEGALQDRRLRRRAARARTDLEVIVLGGGVFQDLSAAFAPVKAALADARRRRTPVWDLLAPAKRMLGSIPIAEVVEPLAVTPLRADDTIAEAVVRIDRARVDACCVVDDDGRLAGLVTRVDLLHAIDLAATRDEARRRDIRVAEFMAADPVAVTTEDSALIAVASMREHGLVGLPVVAADRRRTLVGSVRLENVMAVAMQRHGAAASHGPSARLPLPAGA